MISAGNLSDEIRVFDPHCGLVTVLADVFTDWVVDLLCCCYSDYQ